MRTSLKNLLCGVVASGFYSRHRMPSLRSKALFYLAATLMLLSGAAQAQWLTGYDYRKSLAINAGVAAGTGYQIQVKVGESSGATGFDLHVEGKALNFPNDVRFTDNDATTELSHWLESTTGTAPNQTATFWVKVNDSLDSSQSITAYYAKSAGASGSNGAATFSFFDDFAGGSIDIGKWTIDDATGWSVTGGELCGTNTTGRIRSIPTFSSGVILETKYRTFNPRSANGNMALGFYASASDGFGWLNHPGGDYVRVNGSWTAIGNECKDNIPVIAQMTARATQVDFNVYRLDTGAVWHNRLNNTSTVSNEPIALGRRYDSNGSTYINQTYNAYWDWIRVRKYAATIPTLGAVSAEQANAPTITLTAPANGIQVVSGTSPSATATVTAGTPPYTVEFFKNLNGGGAVSAGTVSASPYTVNLGVLTDGNYTIYAQVTDSLSPTPATATSATHSFSVAPDLAAPTPNPMTFAVVPTSIGTTSIRMAATTATDVVSPAVQYRFWNTTNDTYSGWQSSPTWTESGLTTGVLYTYKVQARDSATPPNETGFSNAFSATPSDPVTRPITLVNPGFESPFLSDGASTSVLPGWSTIGDVGLAAAWNPSVSFYATDAPEGRNIGDIYQSPAYSGFSQFLQGAEGQFQADATYLLKVKVGRNLLDPYDGYIIQMVVNGIVIAQDDNSRTPAAGSFVNTSLKYLYNAALHASLVGYPIEIRLHSKDLGGYYGDVNFDDVQMTYATSNPVAIHGGPYRLSQGAPLSLNGSASIPSPGATITTYEWDIDSRDDHLGFIANLTVPIPAAIPYATLTSTYGMVFGANTIRLRISDNAGQSIIGTTTVTLFPLCTYTGPNANRASNDWNKAVNWSPASIPSGMVDVSIPASKSPQASDATTPEYTGNLYLGANAELQIGWTDTMLQSYNAFGTPGISTIHMATGSSINMRIGGTPIIPAIQLAGNASFTLGSSTGGGAQAGFNYPITGAYRVNFWGNSTGSCVANLNAPNTFNEIYTAGGPYVDGGVTIVGNATGSLGTGNLTLTALGGGGNSGVVIINAANAMADSATLSMSGNTTTKITMNANDTISRLVINGVQMPAGTYGGSASSAAFKQTWMAGTAVLTVTDGQGSYWDTNGVTAGAGGASPTGNWDAASSFWSASTTGETDTASWIAGGSAVFAAGSDATGPYTVTIGDSNAITVSNSFTNKASTGTSSFSTTKAGWALNGGNCVAVMVSSINATGFTASYGGLPMTVQGVNQTPVNAYVGIAYIIAGVNGAPDPLPTTGDVVINVPRVLGVGNTGGYANMGTVYSIQSLSNVASVGTAVSYAHPPGSNPPASKGLTYTTSVNNSYVLGAVCDSDWHTYAKSVVGRCNQIISNADTAKPGYYNPMLCSGSVVAAGTYTDVYSASLTALITLPFNAKTMPNPLLAGTGQKINGLTFEEGAVTITSSKLEMQNTSFFNSASGITATIASQITGLSSSGLTKKGLGILILSNSTNNYTGPTTIINGILRLGLSDSLPDTAVSLSGDAPGVIATLDLNGNSDTVGGLTFGGSSATSGSTITTGAGTLTLSGNVVYSAQNSPLGATLDGNLSLGADTRVFNIADSSTAVNDVAVSAAISGTGGLTKIGFGNLLLSGNNAYTGLTTVTSGLLVLSGSNNSAATGGITVNDSGEIRFDALGSINGTGANVMIEAGGVAYFGSSFDDVDIPSALARIDPESTGVIAVDNFGSTAFNFSGLDVYLGALSDITYSGVFTPKSGEYHLGGGTGAITLTGLNALTGSNALFVGGRVVIANSNNFSLATTINPSGRLQIGAGGTSGSISSPTITNNGMLAFNRSDTLTQGTHFWATIGGTGIVEQAGSGTLELNNNNTYAGGTNLVSGTLRLGHANAIGSGALNIYSGALDAVSALTLASNNPVTLAGSFSFGGTANLNMGTGDVSNTGNHTITLNGTTKALTFGGVMTNISGGDQTLTVDGSGNTLVLGGYEMSSDIYASLIALTIGGSGNVSITGAVEDWSVDENEVRFGSLTKTGTGTLTLSGNNNYTGDTVVTGGVLHLASGTQISPIFVNSGGTLGFTLGTTITSTERLTLNDGHKIKIFGAPTLLSYTLMSASSIAGGAPTLETPISGYFLEIAGDELRLTQEDITPPVLDPADIVDDKNGGPIALGTLITYTLTFNEDINQETVTAADFTNAVVGGPAITIGNIMEISPGVFTVEVTPATAGNLRLSIPPLAEIYDVSTTPTPNALVVPIEDDTTISVIDPATAPWLVSSDIEDDRGGVPVDTNTPIVYTLYFTRDINLGSVSSVDFTNAGTASYTIGTISETSPGFITVQVTATSAGTLKLSIPTTADIRDASNNMLDSDPAIDDDTTITVNAAGYIGWSGGASFNADANNDGVSNGMAWLLGAANINTNAISLLPTFNNTSDPTYFIYTYRRSDAANTAADTSIAVEYCSNLRDWSYAIDPTVDVNNNEDIEITESDNFYGTSPGVDKVEVKIKRSLAISGKLFSRLNLVTTP